MEDFSLEILKVLYALLPGFVTTWFFYGLTKHRPSSHSSHIITALILTLLVKGLAYVVVPILERLAAYCDITFDFHSDNVAFVIPILIAIITGLVMAVCANHDMIHACLRALGVTKNTSYPSIWYSAFYQKKLWVILNFKNGRRLMGWPDEWPDYEGEGHFIISHAEWIQEEEAAIKLHEVESILVPAKDVEMVEFLHPPETQQSYKEQHQNAKQNQLVADDA